MGDLITVKVFIHWNGAPEVRRFVTEKCIVANFHDLTAKLEDVNPRLRGNTYSVFWTDEEGDDVTISSTDDMLIPLGVMQSLVKLSVYCKEEKPETLKYEPAKSVVNDGGKNGDGDGEQRVKPGVVPEPSSAQRTPPAVKNTATASSQPESTSKTRPQHLIPKSNILVINQPLTNDFRQSLKSLVTAMPEAKPETPQQSTENITKNTHADTSSSKYNQKPQLKNRRIDTKKIQMLLNNIRLKINDLELMTYSLVNKTKDKALGDCIMPDGIKVSVDSETSSPIEAEQKVSKDKVEGWTVINNYEVTGPSKAKSTSPKRENGATASAQPSIIKTVHTPENPEQDKLKPRQAHPKTEPPTATSTASRAQNAATAPPQPKSTSKTNPAPDMPEQAKPKPRQPHPKAHIESALQNMIAMGYNDNGGWLSDLLDSKDGNIAEVLQLLTPVNLKNPFIGNNPVSIKRLRY